MNNDILNYCKDTKTIYGILNLFKENFMHDFEKLKPKEKLPIFKALPYLYRMWHYSALIDDTPLSPANFINLQIKEKYGEDSIVVPIASPIYKNKILKDFKFEHKIFNLENHPVLEDMKLFLDQCTPDIGIDETGLLLEAERDTFINSLCFKEIFYITFLTNTAYELKLLRKIPSINTYRAMPNHNNVEIFFNLSSVEQLKKITDAILSIASKALCDTFDLSKKTFSKESLTDLFKNSNDLEKYLDNIFEKFKLNTSDFKALENMDFESLDNFEDLDVQNETLMSFALKFELTFLMDAYLLTPLGYYLQFIKPIYINSLDFKAFFDHLTEAYNSNIPLLKLFFTMSNSYDITSLGTTFLSNGKPPKNEFQKMPYKLSFEEEYKDIVTYNSQLLSAYDDEDYDDDDDESFLTKTFFESICKTKLPINTPKPKSKLSPIPQNDKETITDKNKAYALKVKFYYNKRSWQTIELKGTQTLDDLATAIVREFFLDYYHMYSFFMNNKAYDENYEITCPRFEGKAHITTKYKICDLNLSLKQKFLFIYDFGDDIRFEVEFIGASTLNKEVTYPIVKNASKDFDI